MQNMQNIYEQVDNNKKRSFFVVAGFVLFVAVFGYFFTYLYNYNWSYFIIAILFSSVGSFISYYYSDSLVLSMAHAKPVTRQQFPAYLNAVENLSRVAQIPMPKTYLIDSPAMNAFATGRDPQHGAIAITRGLLEKCTKTELEGVIAHEIAHIKNYDTRLMTIVAILVGSIAQLINFAWHLGGISAPKNRNDERGNNAIFILIGLIIMILAPLVAQLIQLAISRRREFLADAQAVMLTRQPSGLISALKKIAANEDITLETASPATAHLYIDDPVTKETHGEWFANLFSTHPPIAARIKALEGYRQ